MYNVTKEECQKNIDKHNNVCCRCSGKLEPIETVDNSGQPTFWIGCKKCMVFTHGTIMKIYETSKKMVEDGYIHYTFEHCPKDRNSDEYTFWKNNQISGTVRIVEKILNIYENI